MNDEIKEMNIKWPGQILDYVDTKEHLLELYNYITNLQQELEDYKLRCEKAVEFINNYFVLGANSEYKRRLTDILNGRSDE